MPSVATHTQIEARAYQIWELEGRPNGRDLDHWTKASAELAAAKPKKTVAANGNAPTVKAKAPAKAKGAAKAKVAAVK